MKFVDAGVLNVAYLESGPADGLPVILLHEFPYEHTPKPGGADKAGSVFG